MLGLGFEPCTFSRGVLNMEYQQMWKMDDVKAAF